MSYKFKGVPSVMPIQKKFEEYFQISSSVFNDKIWDKMMTIATGNIQIDLIALDDILHERHGEYEENENLSMQSLIVKEYGFDALTFLNQLL